VCVSSASARNPRDIDQVPGAASFQISALDPGEVDPPSSQGGRSYPSGRASAPEVAGKAAMLLVVPGLSDCPEFTSIGRAFSPRCGYETKKGRGRWVIVFLRPRALVERAADRQNFRYTSATQCRIGRRRSISTWAKQASTRCQRVSKRMSAPHSLDRRRARHREKTRPETSECRPQTKGKRIERESFGPKKIFFPSSYDRRLGASITSTRGRPKNATEPGQAERRRRGARTPPITRETALT